MRKFNLISFDKAEELALKLGNQSIRSTMITHNHVVKQINDQVDQDNAAKQASGGRIFIVLPVVVLAAALGFILGFLLSKI